MKNPPEVVITCRALIIDQNQLLMVKHDPSFDYYALPGGKLEAGETLEECMARELLEETNIQAEVGKPLIVNEWLGKYGHRIEFFYWIRNTAAFRHLNTAQATHGFELNEAKFGDPRDPAFRLLPGYLKDEFPHLLKLGEDYPLQLIRST